MSEVAKTIKPFYEVVDGEVIWSGTKYQRLAWESHAKNIWLMGGQRGGKTGSGAKWIVDEIMRCGPYGNAASYSLLAPTLRICMDGYGKAIKDLFCDQLPFFTFNGRDYEFRTTATGEQALFGHRQKMPTVLKMCYAENPRSFAAGTWVAVASDELSMPEFPREAFMQAQARMMTFSGRVAPNNPPAMKGVKMGRSLNCSTVWSMNWVKETHDRWANFYRDARRELKEQCAVVSEAEAKKLQADFFRRERLGLIHPNTTFISFPSFANPAVDPEWIEECRRSWPDWMFRQRILAQFTKPAGVIFEGWDSGVHVVEPFHIPSAWEKWWSIDFGSKNFFALLWAHDKERDRAFVMASYHRDDLTTAQHGRQLKAFCADATRTVAGQPAEDSQRMQLAVGGLPAQSSRYHNFWQGVGDLSAAIMQGRVKVFRNMTPGSLPDSAQGDFPKEMPMGFSIGAPGLSDELAAYSRPINPNTGDVIVDAKPVAAETFHWVDAARYFATCCFTGWGSGHGSAAKNDEPLMPQDSTKSAVAKQVNPSFHGSMSLPGRMRALRYGRDAACNEPPVESFF